MVKKKKAKAPPKRSKTKEQVSVERVVSLLISLEETCEESMDLLSDFRRKHALAPTADLVVHLIFERFRENRGTVKRLWKEIGSLPLCKSGGKCTCH